MSDMVLNTVGEAENITCCTRCVLKVSMTPSTLRNHKSQSLIFDILTMTNFSAMFKVAVVELNLRNHPWLSMYFL